MSIMYESYGLKNEEIGRNEGGAIYRLSAPEIIEVGTVNSSGEHLLASFKKDLLELIYEASGCEDDGDKEFVKSAIKVYGRIRKGEKWTKAEHDTYMKDIKSEIDTLNDYKEV